jgi:MFS transporter, DHA1 family, multidrug resistance protein
MLNISRNLKLQPWQRNLLIIALAEFITIVAFGAYVPFLPLFIQRLGNLGSDQAAFWSGIATGGAGLAMFISAPIWGIIADRWGRKPMLIRAQVGGAIIAALFAIAPNIYFLVGFRILQGLFTGTVAAAAALVASLTPKDKLPLSMGILMGAVFGGQTLGPLLGGFLAETLGFTTTFIITSCLLLVGGLIIVFFIRESFQRPTEEQRTSVKGLLHFASSRQVLPLLLVIAALGLGWQMLPPILPLAISEFKSAGGASIASGQAFALMGIISAISSVIFGRLNRHISIRRSLIIACIGTGLLYLPLMFATSAVQLIIFVGITGLFYGGIITSSNSLVSMTVPANQQGIAYGLSQSATSLGNGIGPFISGILASQIDLRYIFGVAAGIFFLVTLLILKLIPGQQPLKP